MKILYDFQTFTNQQYGGISRYYYELMKSYNHSDEIDFDLGVKYTKNHYLTHSDFLSPFPEIPHNKTIDDILWGKNFKGKGKVFKMYSQLAGNTDIYGENKQFSLDKVKAGDFDVFHPTYYERYFLNDIGDKPFVLTIYDMIHEIFPEQVDSVGTMFEAKRELAQKAAKVIAISESTKTDIIKFYDLDPQKIEVIYLANSLDDSIQPNSKLDLPERFVLFVGNRFLYKNFYIFAAAMAKLIRKDPTLHVVCAGGGSLYDGEKHYLRVLGVESNFHSAPADDASLVACYKNALAFAYPSLYEGFGIPVLEAFACGTPVVASNVSSLPEVGGNAARYFDPKDVTSIADTIAEVIASADLRDSMREQGKLRNREFSWENTARQTAALYKSLV